jgi:hypothetical protein
MDIVKAGYEWNRVPDATIYDRALDVVELYDEQGEPAGMELFADFEIGPNVEYCSAFADEDGSVNAGYPMGNSAEYRIIASGVSWCEAKLYFGVG